MRCVSASVYGLSQCTVPLYALLSAPCLCMRCVSALRLSSDTSAHTRLSHAASDSCWGRGGQVAHTEVYNRVGGCRRVLTADPSAPAPSVHSAQPVSNPPTRTRHHLALSVSTLALSVIHPCTVSYPPLHCQLSTLALSVTLSLYYHLRTLYHPCTLYHPLHSSTTESSQSNVVFVADALN